MNKNPNLIGVDRGDIDSDNIIPITKDDRNDLLLLLHHAAQEIPHIRVKNDSVVDRRRIRRRMRTGLTLLLHRVAPEDCVQIVLSDVEMIHAFEFIVLLGVGLIREGNPHLTEIWQRWLDALSEAVPIQILATPLPILTECQASTADAATLAAYEAIRRCPSGQSCTLSYADVTRLEVWLRYLSTGDLQVQAMIAVLEGITVPMHCIIAGLAD